MAVYHTIWKKCNGSIPKDNNGRSLELHHINNNHDDNRLENLKLVTIEEHYSIHESQGDWGACMMIAKRMGLSPTHYSDIQRGKKRPGIGGAPKGRVPWNKGKPGYKLDYSRKGKRHSSKLSIAQVNEIRKLHSENFLYDMYLKELQRRIDVGLYGQKLPYERFLAKELQRTMFTSFSAPGIWNVIVRKSWTDV